VREDVEVERLHQIRGAAAEDGDVRRHLLLRRHPVPPERLLRGLRRVELRAQAGDGLRVLLDRRGVREPGLDRGLDVRRRPQLGLFAIAAATASVTDTLRASVFVALLIVAVALSTGAFSCP
jgi:hypothetical protein